MAKVKICGITRPEEIAYGNAYQPDYIGFVFARSRRQVSLQKAQELRRQLDSRIQAVGVFVDEEFQKVVEAVETGAIQMIQLHGQEDEAYLKALRRRTSVPIIKALAVNSSLDIQKANESSGDYVLLDYRKPGSGRSFDWELLKGMTRAYFLAGGICSDNIEEALGLPRLLALDISSGVEKDGKKDESLIRDCIRRIRNDER
ncbi:phosphoribosylanthranilate isomerase [Lachnospiraceae bacterium PF1-21]